MSDADYLWDVFLAHASPDKPWCEALTKVLERAGLRVFIDVQGLDAASTWDTELPRHQRQSRITLVYVTKNTPGAWFQRAEIQRAITQKRFGDRKHELVPIWGAGHSKPYGLEMLVGISSLDHDVIAAHVTEVLRSRFDVEVGARFTPSALPDYLTTGLLRPPGPRALPSQLLVASRQVVPFLGREQEREVLHAWADAPGLAVLLVHGRGGVGKTRLVAQWLQERRDRGEVAGLLQGDVSPMLGQQMLGQARTSRVVVAVDYAETRPGLGALLEELARVWQRGGESDLKVVLVARHAGDWWASLRQESLVQSLLDEHPPLELAAVTQSREEVFEEAAQAFAEHLGRPRPAAPSDLDAPGYDRMLFLHVAALLGALSGEVPAVGVLLEGLLERERRAWQRHCTEPNGVEWAERRRALERSLAALTLRGGAPDRTSLEAWLPRVAGEEYAAAFKLLLDQHYAHPTPREGETRQWRSGLEPDLLGEHLVWRVLHQGPKEGLAGGANFVEEVLSDEGAPWDTAFTVLARAEGDHPEDIGPWLKVLVQEGSEERVRAAFEGALAAGSRTAFSSLGLALARVLEDSGSVDLARDFSSRIPEQTVNLRELAVWAASTLLQAGGLPDEARARLQNNLGIRLSELGRREEALAATTEAVEYFRELALARPEVFLPDLAGSLISLGNRLSELDRREEALEATTEAVAHYRELARARPGAFLPGLATSLNNLGVRLSALGRREEALAATTEAVAHYRELARARPGAFLHDLAMSLNNQGNMLSALGRWEEALTATTEAVELRRELARARPGAFLPDLASSLNNLGIRLSALGRREGALEAATEALALRRELARARPGAFLPGLAMSLGMLGSVLKASGRHGEAHEAFVEGAQHLMPLFEAHPAAFGGLLGALLRDAQQTGDSAALKDLLRRLESVERKDP